MTAREAYLEALEHTKIVLGRNQHWFALIGWKSPSSGTEYGPIMVIVDGENAIEVSTKGEFLDVFPAAAEHYFPWIKP